MDTNRFNEEHAAKSRAVCERIEREDAERMSKFADLELEKLKARIKRLEELLDARPAPADSWERLEEDAAKGVCEYAGANQCGHTDAHTCDGCRFDEDGDGPSCEKQMALDIIRRAKALAGVEVD